MRLTALTASLSIATALWGIREHGIAYADSHPSQSLSEIARSMWTTQTRRTLMRAWRELAPRIPKDAPRVDAALILHLGEDHKATSLTLLLPKHGPKAALFDRALAHVRDLLPKLPPAPALDPTGPLVSKVVLRFTTSPHCVGDRPL